MQNLSAFFREFRFSEIPCPASSTFLVCDWLSVPGWPIGLWCHVLPLKSKLWLKR